MRSPIADRLAKIHDIHRELSSSLYAPDALELVLAVATSLAISLRDETALLWLFLITHPSFGKTILVQGLQGSSAVLFVDILTENAFVTGYVEEKTGHKPEGLLSKLNGKTLVVKDLTTIFSLHSDKVKKILGELTAIYDGEFSKATGTRDLIRYESRFPMIACVTPLVFERHHRYMSMIGSRFLAYRLSPLAAEEHKAGFELMRDSKNRKAKLTELNKLMKEHVAELTSSPVSPRRKESDSYWDKLTKLATLLARGRTVVQYESDRVHEIAYVQVEEPWRATQQLRNLGQELARVHGRTRVTKHEFELLRRVALSSMDAGRAEVLSLFHQRPDGTRPCVEELSRKEVSMGIGRGDTATERILDELVAAKVLLVEAEGKGPTAEKRYRPDPEFVPLIEPPMGPLDHIRNLKARR